MEAGARPERDRAGAVGGKVPGGMREDRNQEGEKVKVDEGWKKKGDEKEGVGVKPKNEEELTREKKAGKATYEGDEGKRKGSAHRSRMARASWRHAANWKNQEEETSK